jgi:asparagine synthase (glutamine-hydrolysing)
MSPRYLLVAGDPGPDRAGIVRRLANRTGLDPAFANSDVTALVDPSCRCTPIGDSGCVLGWLFHRHGPARPVADLRDQSAAIAGSEGQSLPGMFWGGYVAAIAHAGSVRVLRDPSGNFPCYYARCGDLLIFASDGELLVHAGVTGASVDFAEIGRQLYRAFVPAPATAIHGIRELLAGFALRVPSRTSAPEPWWSPWDHVAARAEDAEAAAERLRRIVGHCVAAWASTHKRVLLSVSGGLDSSIVAACLAGCAGESACLTMFTDDPDGDERPYARALCERLGLPLIERRFRLEDIDICEPLAANLPRPRDRAQAVAYERVHQAVASKIAADAFMTGNAGDNVLGYSQSAAPVADRYLAEGLGSGILDSLFDVCRQTGCSLFDALAQARRLARSANYRVRPNPLFLHPEFRAELGPEQLRHPWLDAPAGALPGKRAHVANIHRAQPILEPAGGTGHAVLNPLMSQPVIEACLHIQSWEWRAGGRDRSLARRAFAAELPPAIIGRRTKGSPSRFAARLLDHFRPAICERLLAGRLAQQRIVDADAIEKTLAGERPVGDVERVRILELVNAEAWIDHWCARGAAPKTGEALVR